jgi:hypothetical protein
VIDPQMTVIEREDKVRPALVVHGRARQFFQKLGQIVPEIPDGACRKREGRVPFDSELVEPVLQDVERVAPPPLMLPVAEEVERIAVRHQHRERIGADEGVAAMFAGGEGAFEDEGERQMRQGFEMVQRIAPCPDPGEGGPERCERLQHGGAL